jgi:hypothetical protein
LASHRPRRMIEWTGPATARGDDNGKWKFLHPTRLVALAHAAGFIAVVKRPISRRHCRPDRRKFCRRRPPVPRCHGSIPHAAASSRRGGNAWIRAPRRRAQVRKRRSGFRRARAFSVRVRPTARRRDNRHVLFTPRGSIRSYGTGVAHSYSTFLRNFTGHVWRLYLAPDINYNCIRDALVYEITRTTRRAPQSDLDPTRPLIGAITTDTTFAATCLMWSSRLVAQPLASPSSAYGSLSARALMAMASRAYPTNLKNTRAPSPAATIRVHADVYPGTNVDSSRWRWTHGSGMSRHKVSGGTERRSSRRLLFSTG